MQQTDDKGSPAFKRCVDLVVAVPGAIVICALAPWIALANRLTGDRGPTFYSATRVGKRGRTFQIHKFRTMRPTAGPGITFRGDPRITGVGRFLRRSKLDELPQLFNVLRGDMSVVGPRPESPEYVDWESSDQRIVLGVRPGITGSTQLAYFREEESLSDDLEYRKVVLPRKLTLDRWYVEHATARGDVRIIVDTLRAIMFRTD